MPYNAYLKVPFTLASLLMSTIFVCCSYAGLACVEIKGHSKSVGYEPGMKIREDSFQNTWNAVLINGDWWPVQCNWGAR